MALSRKGNKGPDMGFTLEEGKRRLLLMIQGGYKSLFVKMSIQ